MRVYCWRFLTRQVGSGRNTVHEEEGREVVWVCAFVSSLSVVRGPVSKGCLDLVAALALYPYPAPLVSPPQRQSLLPIFVGLGSAPRPAHLRRHPRRRRYELRFERSFSVLSGPQCAYYQQARRYEPYQWHPLEWKEPSSNEADSQKQAHQFRSHIPLHSGYFPVYLCTVQWSPPP